MTSSDAPSRFMAVEKEIDVEVAAATPEKQVVISVRVPAGTTLIEAMEKAGLSALIPGFEVSPERLGIFGRLRALDTPLQAGDRAEAYRALTADPKEIRRQMAELARALKNKGARKQADSQLPEVTGLRYS